MTNRALTKQQELWAKEYVIDFNATRAAIEAGYAEGSASTRGYELSHNPVVGVYIAKLMRKTNKRLEIDADYVRRRLVEIDQRDLLDIMDDDGNILPVKQWPLVWRQSINAIEIGALVRAKDDPDKLIRCVEKLKMPDTLRNLDLLGKHIDVRAWDKEGGTTVEINNIMPVPTADSVEDWEKQAQKQQDEALKNV